jgi:uncharacterized protein
MPTRTEEKLTADETVGIAPATTTTPFHRGAPAAVGVPSFIVGSVALGLHLINYVPSVGTGVAIIFAATGIGQLIACFWSIGLGESVVASIFGIFSGFWLSYAVLVLGLVNNWFGLSKSDVTHTVALFLISWIVVVGLLLLGTLRLPFAFSAIFILIEVALVLNLIGTINTSTGANKAAGVAVFAFAAVGAWVYLDTMSQASGGGALKLGRPIRRG